MATVIMFSFLFILFQLKYGRKKNAGNRILKKIKEEVSMKIRLGSVLIS